MVAYFKGKPLLGGGSSEEVYSTVETRIGTWIDGKPLYRRSIEFSLPSRTTYVDIREWDADTIIDIRHVECRNSGEWRAGPMVYSGVDAYFTWYESDMTQLIFSGSSFENGKCIATISYTKTTD